MDNFQKAVNYETIIRATHSGDAKAKPIFDTLCRWCDVNESIGNNLNVYKFLTGCDENSLYSAQADVLRAFENLPENTQIITNENPLWSKNLIETPFLYLCGNIDLLKKPSISIVGTRKPSDGGIRLTRESVDNIGEKYVIVSGLAKGIDGAAHLEALAKNYNTIAVIGTPLCNFYPPEHKELQQFIFQHGLVVSQFAPSRKIQQYFFIQRNLTMSRISGGSLVVESQDSGGAVKQAQYTAQQQKPIFIYREIFEKSDLAWTKSFAKTVIVPEPSQLCNCIEHPVFVDCTRPLIN